MLPYARAQERTNTFYFMEVYIMGNNTMPKCSCTGCENIGKYAYGVRRRGMNNAYLCEYHKQGLESYFAENRMFWGKPKAHGLTFGIEFETDFSTAYGRLEMMLEGFLPTSDSSIDGPEFKSPIFYGTNAIMAFLPTIDELIESGNIRIDFQENGTHTHVGHISLLNELTMSYIRRFYHSLFLPLSKALEENPAKTAAIFGREFTYYADKINERTNAEGHCNFVNVQHDKTLEWRLVQYHNAKQYASALTFCRKASAIVFNDFCSFIQSAGYYSGQSLSTDQITELKKIAGKVGKKLVKLWEKTSLDD